MNKDDLLKIVRALARDGDETATVTVVDDPDEIAAILGPAIPMDKYPPCAYCGAAMTGDGMYGYYCSACGQEP